MSEQTIDSGLNDGVQDQQGQADGSPPVAELEVPVETEVGEGQPGAPEPNANQVAELRKALSDRDEQLAAAKDLVNFIQSDPELHKLVTGKLSGQVQEPDPLEEAVKKIQDTFDEKTAGPLAGIFRDFAEAISKKSAKELQPALREVHLNALESKRAAGLRSAGVDPAVLANEKFISFEKAYRTENPWIKSVERDDPGQAAVLLGKAFKASAAASQARAQNAAHVADVRQAMDYVPASSKVASSSVPGGVTVRRGPDSARQIRELLKRGIPDSAIKME